MIDCTVASIICLYSVAFVCLVSHMYIYQVTTVKYKIRFGTYWSPFVVKKSLMLLMKCGPLGVPITMNLFLLSNCF